MKRAARVVAAIAGGLLGLCIIASGISALSNRSLLVEYGLTGAATAPPERLTAVDKVRLAEALHLKRALGEQVWPGWGSAEIPVILWTAGSEFLVGASAPDAAGWQPVEDDAFLGEPYYRRSVNKPQNFAVPVGDGWAGSMATKRESDRFLIAMFRDMLPGLLKEVFPYRALILPSEAQITGVLHETFHAYQAMAAPTRLEGAERAHGLGDDYRAADAAMRDAWAKEIDLLITALLAETESEMRVLTDRFLAARGQRRAAADLSPGLADYERQLEWEEGLAKYVEVDIWRQASEATGYRPLTAMADDPLFKEYRTFAARFKQELTSWRRSARQEGETRFYYTGMAQAMLLNHLAPGWQAHAFDDGVWLEDLLMDESWP